MARLQVDTKWGDPGYGNRYPTELLLTLNPYEPVVVDSPKVRIWAVPFAVAATIAFQFAVSVSTGNNLSVYFGSPTAVLQNVVPVFVFSFLIGRFNGNPSDANSDGIALAGRLLGGCILGSTAIPVNWMVMDYLYLIPLPSKIAEVLTVLLIPVIICTVSERIFLRLLAPKCTSRIG